MSPYQRVLVYLQRCKDPPTKAKFTECILKSLKFPGDCGNVTCELKENKLVLGTQERGERCPTSLLTHPPFCPIQCMSSVEAGNLPGEISERGVDVGVVVVLETSDNNILLTRRAKHMRTFPGIWVPPGGHVEAGETLVEAGLRELEEETGLAVASCVRSSRVLCLWESVFPYRLSMGPPVRHHIVVYLLVQVGEDSKALQGRLRLDSSEVDAAMWVDTEVAHILGFDQIPDNCPDSVVTTVLTDTGDQISVSVPAVLMTNQAPRTGQDIERVSTGTRYAVHQWLTQSSHNDPG